MTPASPTRRFRIWLAPAIFTLVGGLAVARSIGSFAAIEQASVSWPDLAAAAAIYPLFAAGRGLRFRLLLARRQSWRETVAIGWLYSAACSLVPGGLGEASLPAVYSHAPGEAAEAAAAVLLTRVQDMLSWLILLVVAGFATVARLPAAAAYLLMLALAGTGAGTALVFLPRFRAAALGLLARLPLPALRAFLADFDRRLGPMAGDVPSWAVTFGLRGVSTFKYYFALRAFGAPVTPVEAAIGGALLALLLALPVQGVAGLGTVELWWIAVLQLFAVPAAAAAVAAVGTHVLLLLLAIVFGCLSLATLPKRVLSGEPVG